MSAKSNSSSKPKPKGILKKPTAPPSSSPPPDSSSQPVTPAELPERQETASRLRLLQKLRDTELKPPVPISTFETLSHFPRAACPPHGASSPSPADTAYFLTALRDFQPSEYLDLIEERNCLNKCGYTLCPQPRRTHGGEFKISVRNGAIARTADLNKWCSDACAARALYLKVQLDNPSYERRDGDGQMVVKLELREERKGGGQQQQHEAKRADGDGAGENKEKQKGDGLSTGGTEEDREQLARAMAQLEINQMRKEKIRQDQAKRDASALAVERGDAGGLLPSQTKVEVIIRERSAVEPAQPPSTQEDAHLMMEGYKTTFGSEQKPGREDDSDDDDEFPTLRF